MDDAVRSDTRIVEGEAPRAARIQDVARLAEVSTATVSRALANPERVSPEARARVMQAIAKVGYIPNPAARTLRSQKSRMVLVVLPNLGNIFFSQILRGIEETLFEAGYGMIIGDLDGSPAKEARFSAFTEAGQVDGARREAQRTLNALAPFVARGARVVGLEPSCLLTFRDEFASLLPKTKVDPLAAAAFLFEEALAADLAAGRIALTLADAGGRVAHLHGHCHQKAFAAMGAVEAVLRAVPGLDVRPIESSCCGMAGAFGYRAATIDASFAIAELSLLPAVRAAGAGDLVVADGTSCRHQIRDGASREAVHVARVLDALVGSPPAQA